MQEIYLSNTINHLKDFNLHRLGASGAKENFWQEFDKVIFQAVWDGEITALKECETEGGGKEFVVLGMDIFNYQLKLLERIEGQIQIPFKYKKTFNYLNREFYRRHDYHSKNVRVGDQVLAGVVIEFE